MNVHFRLSTLFYSTQLVDIFSYEVPASNNNLPQHALSTADSSLLVYNYHSLVTQDRFFLFTHCGSNYNSSSSSRSTVQSVTELFSAANWLEREVSELSGVSMSGKKDLRNLMLQYGDSSTPFKKSFPTIGLREMFYNPVKDTIVQNPVTLQL
jgi:NADH:ubiquinone oxidoreductase subunit C